MVMLVVLLQFVFLVHFTVALTLSRDALRSTCMV